MLLAKKKYQTFYFSSISIGVERWESKCVKIQSDNLWFPPLNDHWNISNNDR